MISLMGQNRANLISMFQSKEDNSLLILFDKVCSKTRQIVIDIGSCAPVVRPDIIPVYGINNPEVTDSLETANREPVSILGMHEAKFLLIFDEVIFGPDILQTVGFKLLEVKDCEVVVLPALV